MTVSTAALRTHHERIDRMFADPDCMGEILLVGQGMARCLDLGQPAWTGGKMPMKPIAKAIYGPHWLPSDMLVPYERRLGVRGDTNPYRRVLDVFYADRRRYDSDLDEGRAYGNVICGRPMIRRDGTCDRGATDRMRLTDPATGRRSWVGCCGQRACKTWFAGLVERNRAELAAHSAPLPPANVGGVLERHLPELDWWAVWSRVDKHWKPPVEGEALARPKLQLVLGDDASEPLTEVAVRPQLVALEGGWR